MRNSNSVNGKLEKIRTSWYGWKLAIPLSVLIIAVVGGILTGNWLTNRRAAIDNLQHVDEYYGLGKRTGMTGDRSRSFL